MPAYAGSLAEQGGARAQRARLAAVTEGMADAGRFTIPERRETIASAMCTTLARGGTPTSGAAAPLPGSVRAASGAPGAASGGASGVAGAASGTSGAERASGASGFFVTRICTCDGDCAFDSDSAGDIGTETSREGLGSASCIRARDGGVSKIEPTLLDEPDTASCRARNLGDVILAGAGVCTCPANCMSICDMKAIMPGLGFSMPATLVEKFVDTDRCVDRAGR